jgi:putative Mg2+ transporter-C (MgtC) family protein
MIPGMEPGYFHYTARLLFALAIGGVLGLQREIEGKPAGMRTNMLMCLGSCLLMILSIEVSRVRDLPADPTRIAAQVMTGIGFLGAGAILKARLTVTGLTSAATIWFVAAMGLVIGWGAYVLAALGTALVLLVLSVLGKFENVVGGKQRRHILVFRYPMTSQRMKQAKRLYAALRIYVEDIQISRDGTTIVAELEYVTSETSHQRAVEAIRSMSDTEIVVEY